MRLKFAVLATVGAIAALAAPASSMAAFSPSGFQFEINGDSNGPALTTSLGSCSLAKIVGTTPTEKTNIIPVMTVTPGTCTSGASISVGPGWAMETAGPYTVVLRAATENALALRYASLPGCKLTAPVLLAASWNNGYKPAYEGAEYLKSGYHPDSTGTMTWRNDGTTCALAGQTEAVRYEDTQSYNVVNPGYYSIKAPVSAVVTDKTASTYPILVH